MLDKESTTFWGRRYKQIAENVVLSPRLNKVTNEYMERKNSTPNFACCWNVVLFCNRLKCVEKIIINYDMFIRYKNFILNVGTGEGI